MNIGKFQEDALNNCAYVIRRNFRSMIDSYEKTISSKDQKISDLDSKVYQLNSQIT